MSTEQTTELSAEDARRTRILEGAKQAFLAYGFQRTTMDDIARAAEISRPALYLMFKNKSDIYRALASAHMDVMLATTARALESDGSLEGRLEQALGSILAMTSEIEDSPHGADILDMKNSLAADIIAEWRVGMTDLIEAAIGAEMSKDGGDKSPKFAPRMLADMLLDAKEGMKMRQIPAAQQRAALAAFVRVVVQAAGH
ncbi:MAG: TetR/AcrR family transcriptional regulator [Rhizobiaceae bacterium]|nr:TetR/AcrR family transcriptional regulator [Rhizobiaceae bacterium]